MYKPAEIYKEQEDIREALLSVLHKGLKRLPEDIEALEPAGRIKVLLEIAEFVLPKIGRADNSAAYRYTIHTEHEEELKPKSIRRTASNTIRLEAAAQKRG